MEIRTKDRVVKFDPSKIYEALEKALLIGDANKSHYESAPDGTLYRVEIGQTKDGDAYETRQAIANHTPVLIKQRIVDNGIETTEELIFNVRRAGRMWGDVPIALKDILSQQPNGKFGGACRIFPNVRGAKAWYSDAMQMQCEDAQTSILYRHTGYAMIDGERVFLNGGYSVTAGGMTDKYTVELEGKLSRYGFVNTRHDGRYKTLLEDLPKVAPESLIFTALGQTFVTPLNRPLKDVGYEPRFILCFLGKTGSRKSTMANLFLCFFGTFRETESAPISFNDTPNAAEMIMAELDSTNTLLDDLIPSVTRAIKEQNERMWQSCVRKIGDRAGRARLNANSTLKPVPRPVCNLIVTAEELPANMGESTAARFVTCELTPGDVDLQALTTVQSKAYELNECMSEYIQYVLNHWDDLADKCREMFLEYRDKAQNGGHGRLAAAVAHLQIGISVMCDWLISVKAITESQSEAIRAKAWAIFMELSAEQNRRIYEEKPTKLFINAVREMIASRDIIFLPVTYKEGADKVDVDCKNRMGYKDENFYYAHAGKLYSEVCRYYAAQGKNFPLSQAAIFRQLADEKIIKPKEPKDGKPGQSTRQKKINGDNVWFLWIRADVLEESEETET